MEREIYLCENFTKMSHYLHRRFWLEETDTPASPEAAGNASDPVQADPSLRKALRDRLSDHRMAFYEDGDFCYLSFQLPPYLYVIGPVTTQKLNGYHIRQYLRNHKVTGTIEIPSVNVGDFLDQGAFFYYDLTNRLPDTEGILQNDTLGAQDQGGWFSQMLSYEEQHPETEQLHYTYEQEQEMGNLFVQGKSGGAPTMIQGLSFENFGTIAQNDVKQFEYFCVCTITVLCRNIIHAGVPDATAYKTSDVVLQKLSVAKTPSEMYQILQNGVAAMEAEVNRVRSATKGNVHVRKARNYIAAHIREKIRLQEIADAIGISSSYLSRVFSQETGKSISQFILEEKMNVACNLLKYSDYSVTNISTYINVVPQSYFSSVFRQIVGSTPQQYRQSHQSVDS